MKLSVIGIGPGGADQITPRAAAALASCDLLAGYTVYVDLIRPLYPHKSIISTPMKQEIDRCKLALEAAATGKAVALVCSGDSGVYGLAGLVYTLAQQYPQVEIEIIPGVTAACSGAAVLGAPLIHDFAVISLSDLLTPWQRIALRLEATAVGDFVICLYNPSSKKRQDYLQKACDIILQHRSGDTVCGLAQNIGRPGECGTVLTLQQLRDTPVDMFTTVFIGNSQTQCIAGKMVTPRGYKV